MLAGTFPEMCYTNTHVPRRALITTLSQYLRAERLDPSEPAAFYVPGLADWDGLSCPRGRMQLARRAEGPDELWWLDEEQDDS